MTVSPLPFTATPYWRGRKCCWAVSERSERVALPKMRKRHSPTAMGRTPPPGFRNGSIFDVVSSSVASRAAVPTPSSSPVPALPSLTAPLVVAAPALPFASSISA
ncbi:hypothetical protein CLOM_g4227 [Closterium sp. NIES-68]|nr:hypothetical protein CLOM_g4227 [Closterium sp. NIES-68]